MALAKYYVALGMAEMSRVMPAQKQRGNNISVVSGVVLRRITRVLPVQLIIDSRNDEYRRNMALKRV